MQQRTLEFDCALGPANNKVYYQQRDGGYRCDDGREDGRTHDGREAHRLCRRISEGSRREEDSNVDNIKVMVEEAIKGIEDMIMDTDAELTKTKAHLTEVIHSRRRTPNEEDTDVRVAALEKQVNSLIRQVFQICAGEEGD
ncbi:hypothetical protein BGX28_007770 [Mortierella sp. GBA30]|nr:hypothetical protein BGX28_007770 [Mortierella sp. GBA30]